ncbi:MAG: hypothetical protein GOU98_03290 [Candidatus Altiarchaeota archaeon]|nr:hypothetical protein [Candidatus Altiarchaeota archaeon]
MNKLLLLVLVGLAASIFMVPFIPMNGDLVRAELYTSDQKLVLIGDEGRLDFDFTFDTVYSSENPYDFFPQLIDPSSIQRVELLPYLTGISCNVLDAQGKTISGDVVSCLALATSLDLPIYVHKDLFSLPTYTIPGNFQV